MAEILLGSHVGNVERDVFRLCEEYGKLRCQRADGSHRAPQNTRRKENRESWELMRGFKAPKKQVSGKSSFMLPILHNLGNMEKPEMLDFMRNFWQRSKSRAAVFMVRYWYCIRVLPAPVWKNCGADRKGTESGAQDAMTVRSISHWKPWQARAVRSAGTFFEELRMIYDRVERKDRSVGMLWHPPWTMPWCDLVNDYEGVWQFDKILGLDQIAGSMWIHSLNPLGSPQDRHAIMDRAPSVMTPAPWFIHHHHH